jgi:hypothetical protein
MSAPLAAALMSEMRFAQDKMADRSMREYAAGIAVLEKPTGALQVGITLAQLKVKESATVSTVNFIISRCSTASQPARVVVAVVTFARSVWISPRYYSTWLAA